MVHKPKSVKYKVVLGYILLFAIAVCAAWVIYTGIVKAALPAADNNDNKNIIRVSNTITSLYASEALARNSILTGSQNDFNHYSRLIDSIHIEIDSIKHNIEAAQAPKLDSIQFLLDKKRKSVIELMAYRKKYGKANTYERGIDKMGDTKDSLWNEIKPVQTTKKYNWQKTIDAILTPTLRDSLAKLPMSADSLALAYKKMFAGLAAKERRLETAIIHKELQLLEENRIISDQLRVILSSLEKDFLQKSYAKISTSRTAIDNTVKTAAWLGAVALLLLIFFAWMIIRDLTTNQNYRKQLEVLNKQNEELLRTKTMLMATVTHDLQTPLGSILGFHDLIRDSGVTSKQQQYLGNIKESADYICRLVNDMLDFSKLENNRLTIEKSPFNIKSLIENTCMTLEPMALSKNIELSWYIDEELNSNFITDPYRVKQVLTNLVSNAVKFTSEGSVEVTAKLEDGKIYISVLDTGIGIARDKHAEVFKEFTQAHSGIERKFGGTGLGLTISQKILNLLEGDITLESEVGQGSIFTISLLAIAAPGINSETHKTEVRHDIDRLSNKKILIVDDDTMQLTLMRELFANYPVAVTTEDDAQLVIQLLEKEYYDLVLTDIQMPSVDGFTLVKQIRDKGMSIPVIALSGKRNVTSEEFTKAGFTAHHPKPVQFEQLLELISAVLTGKAVVEKSLPVEPTGNFFNLQSLSQFTNNDPASLKTILQTFVTSARENCLALKKAAAEHDEQMLAETAHKMIPMLKQMEVHSVANLLIPLEERTLTMTKTEMQHYIDHICDKMEELCEQLFGEMA